MANPFITQAAANQTPDVADIQRKQQLAQMLMQQGMAPDSGPQMLGQVAVRKSPMEGLAKLLQTYAGTQLQGEAAGAQKQMAEALKQRREGWRNEMPQAQPAQNMGMGEIDPSMAQFGNVETQAAKNPSSQDYLAWALKGMDVDPQMAQFGMKFADSAEAREARTLAQKQGMEQRLAELKMRMEDQRASQQERLAAQQEAARLQREFQTMMAEQSRQQQTSMARLTASLRPEPDPHLTSVEDPKNPGQAVLVPAKTAAGMRPFNKKEEGSATQKVSDAKDAIGLIDMADKLLDDATASYAGKARDFTAGVFGGSTKGAEAAAQLRALEGMLVSKMPKMSGPQSDKDVLLYRQMAAQVGDDTIPAARRRAALKTVREIQERYAGRTGETTGSFGPTPGAMKNVTVDF